MKTKLIILDRDGVINYDSDAYIKSPEEWHAIPGSVAAIARLNKAGYKVAVASNQSGIGRGLYSEETLQAIHQKMYDELAKAGAHIDKVFYCPHTPNDNCACRKPKTGLLQQIAKYFDVDLHDVPFVGDKLTDIECGLQVGATMLVVSTGYLDSSDSISKKYPDVKIFADLAAVVDFLLVS